MDSIEELGRLDLPDVSIAMRVKQEHRGENGGKRDREGDLKRKEGEREKRKDKRKEGEREKIEISALCQKRICVKRICSGSEKDMLTNFLFKICVKRTCSRIFFLKS